MTTPERRRYIVKGYAASPTWSGCTWANSCGTLEAAKALYFKKVSAFEAGTANANAILLIDRQLQVVVLSVGTENPEKVANSYGW